MIWKVDFGDEDIVANNKKINTDVQILLLDVTVMKKEYIFLNLSNVYADKFLNNLQALLQKFHINPKKKNISRLRNPEALKIYFLTKPFIHFDSTKT